MPGSRRRWVRMWPRKARMRSLLSLRQHVVDLRDTPTGRRGRVVSHRFAVRAGHVVRGGSCILVQRSSCDLLRWRESTKSYSVGVRKVSMTRTSVSLGRMAIVMVVATAMARDARASGFSAHARQPDPAAARSGTRGCAGGSAQCAVVMGGAVTGGVGLILAAVGFGVFAGIHTGNPGRGLEIDGFDDVRDTQRVVRVGRAMGGMGIAGGIAAIGGAIALAIGLSTMLGRSGRARARRVALIAGGPALRF